MPEHGEMSQEAEIAVLSNRIEQLTIGFDEFKIKLNESVKDIHGHITRKFEGDLQIKMLELERKINKDTDTKITRSITSLKTMIQTWAVILVFGITATVGVITYFTNIKSQGSTTTTAQEMGDLYKIISQENRKNVKQTEVIIKPERVIP